MNRRELLRTSGLTALGTAFPALAQSATLQMGCPVPMSGPFAANGKFADLGAQLAIAQYGNVLGRKLAYVVQDTEGKPATAVRKVQEASQQGMRFFAGGILSSETLAMGKEIDKAGGVLVTTAGADEITGKDCARGMFRWSVPTFGAIAETVRPLIDSLPKAKRWYTITPQYVFGDGMLSAAKAVFKEKGVEHAGNSYHSLTEKEFSGYLTNAMAAQPDVLLLLNFGTQSSDALRQAISFGMNKRMAILVAWASGLEQFEALGPALCEGVYFGAQYWHTVDTPLNRELVKRSQAMFKRNPNYSMAGSYISLKLLIDAMTKAGSVEPKDVIAALEGMQYAGLTGDEQVRQQDHQVLKNYYLLKGKAKAAMKDKDDYMDVVNAGQSFLPPEQTGCKLG